jgi:hypothetical protein
MKKATGLLCVSEWMGRIAETPSITYRTQLGATARGRGTTSSSSQTREARIAASSYRATHWTRLCSGLTPSSRCSVMASGPPQRPPPTVRHRSPSPPCAIAHRRLHALPVDGCLRASLACLGTPSSMPPSMTRGHHHRWHRRRQHQWELRKGSC